MNCIAALKTQRLFAASVVLTACCLFAVPLQADNVINTINGAAGFAILGGPPDARRTLEAAWNQTSAFSNVGVAAMIDPGESETESHSFSGTAFLMNQIGPGTTVANEIGHSPFTVTGTAFNPTLVTLFTGLTLPSGTYYLILTAAVGQTGGWENADVPTLVVAAPGVTLVEQKGLGGEPAYPPTAIFHHLGGNALEFQVTGNAVASEPGALVLAAFGVLPFVGIIRARLRRR